MAEYPPKELMVRVGELEPGDFVDLEGDAFADDGEDPGLEFEYAVVEQVEWETDDVVRVDFENARSVGFPATFRVKVNQEHRLKGDD